MRSKNWVFLTGHLISSIGLAINCQSDLSPMDTVICREPELLALQQRLERVYDLRYEFARSEDRASLSQRQKEWIALKENCRTELTDPKKRTCLQQALSLRINAVVDTSTKKLLPLAFQPPVISIDCDRESMTVTRQSREALKDHPDFFDLGSLYQIERRASKPNPLAGEEYWGTRGPLEKNCRLRNQDVKVLVQIHPGNLDPFLPCGKILDFDVTLMTHSAVVAHEIPFRTECSSSVSAIVYSLKYSAWSNEVTFTGAEEADHPQPDLQRVQIVSAALLEKLPLQGVFGKRSIAFVPVSKEANALTRSIEKLLSPAVQTAKWISIGEFTKAKQTYEENHLTPDKIGQSDLGESALLTAVRGPSVATLDWLISLGLKPVTTNACADCGQALHLAAFLGKSEMIPSLIEAGADVNGPNFEGATPLMFAVGNAHSDTVRVLLALGAKSAPQEKLSK